MSTNWSNPPFGPSFPGGGYGYFPTTIWNTLGQAMGLTGDILRQDQERRSQLFNAQWQIFQQASPQEQQQMWPGLRDLGHRLGLQLPADWQPALSPQAQANALAQLQQYTQYWQSWLRQNPGQSIPQEAQNELVNLYKIAYNTNDVPPATVMAMVTQPGAMQPAPPMPAMQRRNIVPEGPGTTAGEEVMPSQRAAPGAQVPSGPAVQGPDVQTQVPRQYPFPVAAAMLGGQNMQTLEQIIGRDPEGQAEIAAIRAANMGAILGNVYDMTDQTAANAARQSIATTLSSIKFNPNIARQQREDLTDELTVPIYNNDTVAQNKVIDKYVAQGMDRGVAEGIRANLRTNPQLPIKVSLGKDANGNDLGSVYMPQGEVGAARARAQERAQAIIDTANQNKATAVQNLQLAQITAQNKVRTLQGEIGDLKVRREARVDQLLASDKTGKGQQILQAKMRGDPGAEQAYENAALNLGVQFPDIAEMNKQLLGTGLALTDAQGQLNTIGDELSVLQGPAPTTPPGGGTTTTPPGQVAPTGGQLPNEDAVLNAIGRWESGTDDRSKWTYGVTGLPPKTPEPEARRRAQQILDGLLAGPAKGDMRRALAMYNAGPNAPEADLNKPTILGEDGKPKTHGYAYAAKILEGAGAQQPPGTGGGGANQVTLQGPSGPFTVNAPGMQPGSNTLDLSNRPIAYVGGTATSLMTRKLQVSGKTVLIPSISPDGKVLSSDDAAMQYYRTHQALGIFDTEKQADDFDAQLHDPNGEYQRQFQQQVRDRQAGATMRRFRRQEQQAPGTILTKPEQDILRALDAPGPLEQSLSTARGRLGQLKGAVTQAPGAVARAMQQIAQAAGKKIDLLPFDPLDPRNWKMVDQLSKPAGLMAQWRFLPPRIRQMLIDRWRDLYPGLANWLDRNAGPGTGAPSQPSLPGPAVEPPASATPQAPQQQQPQQPQPPQPPPLVSPFLPTPGGPFMPPAGPPT